MHSCKKLCRYHSKLPTIYALCLGGYLLLFYFILDTYCLTFSFYFCLHTILLFNISANLRSYSPKNPGRDWIF